MQTYPLVEIIAAELYSRIRHNPYTVRTIPSHESPEALFPPHFSQCLPNAHLIVFSSNTLYLEKNL